METKEDYKYQDIKELADNFNSVQMELNNKIEDYLIDTLRKFNDDFIEFDEKQQEETKSTTVNTVWLQPNHAGSVPIRLKQPVLL